jgi:N-acetylglucosaminyl-diphospho-decaprenol L-rhamnosyltransferase
MPSLAIVIVSWNVRNLLSRCIRSAHASLAGSGISYTILVVDNASSDGTPSMLRAEHPEVQLLEPRRNLGFAGGNNLALRRVLSFEFSVLSSEAAQHSTFNTQHSKFDYVMLLNPDTEVVGDAIPRLARYLEAHPDVAVAGPKLLYPDGSAQPSRRRFPTAGTFFWESTPLETRWRGNPWARRYRYADTSSDVAQEVDWLVGAALLVRSAAIERAGLLDAGFTMYSEELEWQRRIRRLDSDGQSPISDLQSLKIAYVPDAVIVHHEGKSSEQALARRYLDFQRSRLRYARMVHGARLAAWLRLFLRAAYAFELAVEAAKWLLGHKRALRAQRVAVYWQVVRGL